MSQRIRAGEQEFYPGQRGRTSRNRWLAALVLLIVLAGLAGWWLWQHPQALSRLTGAAQQGPAAELVPAATGTAPEDAAATEASPADFLAVEPQEPQNPIEVEPEQAVQLPPLEQSDSAVAQTFSGWLGQDKTYAFIQNEQFIRRFVATVDNLPRERAPARLWPVNPTHPRFMVEGGSGSDMHIAAGNNARYQPVVQLVQSVDAAQAASYYKQYYPLFQQAYEDLGYPGQYFNDRLIAVIDHLLQAPEPIAPNVRQVEIRGEAATTAEQPWQHYEFEDPKLQALSAGQKMLVRMGPDNAHVLKAQLRAFRSQIAAGNAPAQ
ncbi:DUF3014 domain-containing protein [Corticibacter populi]|uniref:DUF3014 domain-containing protein n=1 Tax=Corticibacter populi TaxID=1550736 RepID=A0A3M6QV74_9BURK|nr:DUF3014 domain-containing protein [Corticibacter populi]RMX06915.1 DUF3014 domain-containing protein [Corticibacter populi]